MIRELIHASRRPLATESLQTPHDDGIFHIRALTFPKKTD
jgi:hypothetical protein